MLKIIETRQSFAKYSCQEDFPVFPCLDNLIHYFKSCLISPDPKLLLLKLLLRLKMMQYPAPLSP